jgi:hypothetical protein
MIYAVLIYLGLGVIYAYYSVKMAHEMAQRPEIKDQYSEEEIETTLAVMSSFSGFGLMTFFWLPILLAFLLGFGRE